MISEANTGLGSQFYQADESWLIQQQAQSVFSAALEENQQSPHG
ncbi:hypothetical protein [Nostoc sp. PA-18-2419]|nr:hypothetical protein [Nostoc sp. PA-18-2419]